MSKMLIEFLWYANHLTGPGDVLSKIVFLFINHFSILMCSAVCTATHMHWRDEGTPCPLLAPPCRYLQRRRELRTVFLLLCHPTFKDSNQNKERKVVAYKNKIKQNNSYNEFYRKVCTKKHLINIELIL